MKNERSKKLGRPGKKDKLTVSVSVRLLKKDYEKLQNIAAGQRLPTATLARIKLLDWLEAA